MKKIFAICIVVLLTACILFACASPESQDDVYGGENYSSPIGYVIRPSLPLYDGVIGINAKTGARLGFEEVNTSTYTQITENGYVSAQEVNEVYLSLDNNTASYANLRGMINNGITEIPQDAVRIEEMLNYFSYDYIEPIDTDFSLTYSLIDAPYAQNTKLLTLGLKGAKVETSEVVNNVVLLIDVSGSMYGADRLGLIQEAFKLITENLKPQDRVSVVTYASGVDLRLDGAYGYESNKIRAVIEDLSAGGSTNGEGGIELAYKTAEKYFIEGGNNRIILATDGDFNVGVSGTEGVTELIKSKRESGVYLSVLGVGYGNLQAETMESMALNGNGNWAYLDSLFEARKVLVEEFGGTFRVLAKDAKAKVEFNPEYVESYRLVGYENKQISEEDFENEEKDAGEIGSGHSVTVVFEVKLTEKEIEENALLATATMHYKREEENKELHWDVYYQQQQTSDRDRFVTALVEFGLLLRESSYKGSATLESVLELIDFAKQSDNVYYKDFYALVQKYASNLAENAKD